MEVPPQGTAGFPTRLAPLRRGGGGGTDSLPHPGERSAVDPPGFPNIPIYSPNTGPNLKQKQRVLHGTKSLGKRKKSDEKVLGPASFKPTILSKTSQVSTSKKSKSPSLGSPIRKGRSVLTDGGRQGRSYMDWETQQHWSEVT